MSKKFHLDNGKEDWKNVMWSDGIKMERFGFAVFGGTSADLHSRNIIPIVRYGYGNIMLCGYFSAKGTGRLVHIDREINCAIYCDILVKELKIDHGWAFSVITMQSTQPRKPKSATLKADQGF